MDETCSVASFYESTGRSDAYVGGVIGGSSYGAIENIVNMGRVTFNGNLPDSVSYVGGIIGHGRNYGTDYIINCVNYGSITFSGKSMLSSAVGGIVGHSTYLNVYNCLNYGSITHNGMSNEKDIGGIVGFVESSIVKIDNCVSVGGIASSEVSDTTQIGSVVGRFQGSIISNCYWGEIVRNYDICGYGCYSTST